MIPVKDVYAYLEMMLHDEWGYIWGTAGVMWTQARQDAVTDDMARQYGSQWIGHMVSDCSGVPVYIWRKYGLSIPHGSNSMVRQGYVREIGGKPFPGAAAFVYKEDQDDYSHIGIVGEDGETVYEAKGTRYGFVTSKVSDRKWNRFGRFKDVDYTGGDVKPMKTPYYAIVATESSPLNVRAEPSETGTKIGKAAKGSTVKVITHGDMWDFIDTGTFQGYAATRYLQPVRECPDVDPGSGGDITLHLTRDEAQAYKKTLASLIAKIDAGLKE